MRNLLRVVMLCGLAACGAGEPGGVGTRYLFTAPADGYVRLDLTDLGAWRALITPFVEGYEAPITNFANTRGGEEVHAYLAVTAGADYVFEVAGYDTVARQRRDVAHRFEVDFHPLTDAFEPNDTAANAWPLTTGTIEALLTAGYFKNGLDSDAFDDWYSVTAQGASLTVTLETMPSNLSAVLRVFDAANPERRIAQVARKGEGTGVTVTASTTPGLTYLVSVGCAWNGLALSGQGSLPANFLEPYRLVLTHDP